MTICFSLTNLDLGGAQVFVVRLANELAQRSGNTIYIYDHWPEYRNTDSLHHLHPLVKILSYSENPAERWLTWKINTLLKIFNKDYDYRYRLNQKRFLKRINKNEINLVNSHMSYSDFVISEIDLPSSCRLVLTLHGEYELLLKEEAMVKHHKNRIKGALEKASAIIYTADKNLVPVKKLWPAAAASARKINIGFSPEAFDVRSITKKDLDIEADEFVAGMISRGIPDKGWDTAIAAVRLHNRNAGRKITLLCIGNGAYLKNLVEACNDKHVRLISFNHNFQDYFSYYRLFDVFLFPTRFEGESVPNVVIESLFWQVPVLTTAIAELPAMLRSESELAAGICVEKNDAETFAENLALLISDPSKLHQLKTGCQSAFKQFKMTSVLEKYISVFDQARQQDRIRA